MATDDPKATAVLVAENPAAKFKATAIPVATAPVALAASAAS